MPLKSILLITEIFETGGLETQLAGEIRSLRAAGYAVHLACGPRFSPRLLPTSVSSVSAGLALSYDATAAGFLDTVDHLSGLVEQHGIGYVHAHPFTSLIAAQAVAARCGIPLILTLHGPASFADDYGPLFGLMFRSLVLPFAALVTVVSEEVAELASPYVDETRLLVQPNAVDCERFAARDNALTEPPFWLLVSRLDSHKMPGIMAFLSAAKELGLRVKVAGDGPERQTLQALLTDANAPAERERHHIEWLGERTDIEQLMPLSVGVAGMGRVALEGLAAGKPVMLVGYDGIKGRLDDTLFPRAAWSNFSGRGLPSISVQELQQQLERVRLQPDDQARLELPKRYRESHAWADFAARLPDLTMPPGCPIPALLAELRQDAHASTAPLLGSNLLWARLGEVLHGQCIASPTLVAAYQFYAARRPWSPGVSEQEQGLTHSERIAANTSEQLIRLADEVARQSQARCDDELVRQNILRLADQLVLQDQERAQLTQLLTAKDEKIVQLEQAAVAARASQQQLLDELALMINSRSWRLTRPLRGMGRLLREPAATTARIARRAKHRLPMPLQLRLAHAWHRLRGAEQQARAVEAAMVRTTARRRFSTWEAFATEILAHRDRYRGVFIQSTVIPWDLPLYQRPQHMATALGRLGYLVLYRTSVALESRVVEGVEELAENVWLTACDEVGEIKHAVTGYYSTSFWHTTEDLARSRTQGPVLYEYIDHIDPAITGAETVGALEAIRRYAFDGGADYVVASARSLEEEARAAFPPERVLYVPNGVDMVHYDAARKASAARLPDRYVDFLGRHRGIVGYFGAIAPWLWYSMLAELIAMRPDLGFVCIGPDYSGAAEQLPTAANLLWLGPVPYQDLPRFAAPFDVAMIPFAPGEIARTTSPLKLFEYFALGKPVVVTADMRECTAFAEVFAADGTGAFSAAIDRALSSAREPAAVAALLALARDNDWLNRARQLAPLFPVPSVTHGPDLPADA